MNEDLTEDLSLSEEQIAKIDRAPTSVLAGMIKAAELIAITKTTQDKPDDYTNYAIRVHAKRLAQVEQERHREIAHLRKNSNRIAQWALGISVLAIIASGFAAFAA